MKRPGRLDLDPGTLHDAEEKSKSMIGIGKEGRPFLDYLLYHAEQAGYRDIVLVIGEDDQPFREYYGKADSGNRFHRLEISYAVQKVDSGREKPAGTADALLQGLKAKPEWRHRAFTVCNSDNLYSVDSLGTMLSAGNQCAMVAFDRAFLGQDPARAEQFAVVKTSADGFLREIIEKPSPEEIARIAEVHGSVGVSMNLFRFEYDRIFPFLEAVPMHPVRLEKELPAAVMLMVYAFPECMRTSVAKEAVPDLTSRDDIHRVRQYIERTYPDFSWS